MGELSAVEGTARGLDLVSGKWTMLVVFELADGPRRPSELGEPLLGLCRWVDEHWQELEPE